VKTAGKDGHVNQYIGDQYIEYSLRNLILNVSFEVKGIPKAMNSVKHR
jgi:hypothetical protein